MPIDGIEGKDFVDKQFSSEEIRLVRRLPKNLQDRALKCLKEQKIICESDRSIESDSHTKSEQEKRSKSKSKVRSGSLSGIQPLASRVPKAARKKVNNKNNIKLTSKQCTVVHFHYSGILQENKEIPFWIINFQFTKSNTELHLYDLIIRWRNLLEYSPSFRHLGYK